MTEDRDERTTKHRADRRTGRRAALRLAGQADELYRHYHDHEWGRPVADDIRLFEKICLEGFQSGLSWLTILRKRENFREAFAGFDFDTRRRVHREGCRAAAAECRHHPPSRQDRLDHQQRQAGARAGRRGRLARRLVLEIRAAGARAADSWSTAPRSWPMPKTRDLDADLEGAEEARLELCRPDHGLRLHAGDGHGQRPYRGLRLPAAGRAGTQAVQAAVAASRFLTPCGRCRGNMPERLSTSRTAPCGRRRDPRRARCRRWSA